MLVGAPWHMSLQKGSICPPSPATKILQCCQLSTCDIHYVLNPCICPPTLQTTLKILVHICARESFLQRKLNRNQAFAIVVSARFNKHLHVLLLDCPPTLLHNDSPSTISRKHNCSACSASHLIVIPFNFTRTMLCRAQQNENPTTIMCKLHQFFIDESLFYWAQNHKRSIGDEHLCNFVKTEGQKFWHHKSKCYSDPNNGRWEGTHEYRMIFPWWHAFIECHGMASRSKWQHCNDNLTTSTHNMRHVLPPWHLLQQMLEMYFRPMPHDRQAARTGALDWPRMPPTYHTSSNYRVGQMTWRGEFHFETTRGIPLVIHEILAKLAKGPPKSLPCLLALLANHRGDFGHNRLRS